MYNSTATLLADSTEIKRKDQAKKNATKNKTHKKTPLYFSVLTHIKHKFILSNEKLSLTSGNYESSTLY